MLRHGLGFSLLELLLALLLSGVLLLMATPVYHHLVVRQAADLVLKQLLFEIRFVRHVAIDQGQSVGLCPSVHGQSCGGQWRNQRVMFALDASGAPHVLRVFPASDSGILTWASFPSSAYLRFAPSGMSAYQNGTFTYRSSPNASWLWQVIVSQSGRVRVLHAT